MIIKKSFFLLAFCFVMLWVSESKAQLIDVLQFHVGNALFPQDEKRDFITGKPTNLYAGFEQAPLIGVAVTKFVTDKIQLVAGGEFMAAFKPNYILNISKINANLKYSFLSPDVYRFSPYITGGGNFMYMILSQQDFKREVNIDDPNYKGGEQGVTYNTISYRENNFTFSTPIWGTNVGLGLDVNVYNKYSVFIEGTYEYNFAKNTSVQENYKKVNYGIVENKSQLIYFAIRTGLKIYMY